MIHTLDSKYLSHLPNLHALSPRIQHPLVTAITKTKNNHESIISKVGSSNDNSYFELVTMEDIPKDHKFQHVVFCAPPSGFEDYAGAVKDVVANLWSGPENGHFVFTSSGGM